MENNEIMKYVLKYQNPPKGLYKAETKEYDINSPEYKAAYDSGHLTRYNPNTDTYNATPLEGPTIVANRKYSPLEEWGNYVASHADASSPGGAMLSTIGAALQMPQLMGGKLFTGKVQTPSEALNIKNPIGALATDIVVDPLNLVGLGLLKNPIKFIKNSSFNPNENFSIKSILDLEPIGKISKELVKDIPLSTGNYRTSQDLSLLADKASKIVVDYIKNPIIANTAEHNTLLSKRVKLPAPVIVVSGNNGTAVIKTSIKDYRLNNLRKNVLVGFHNLGKDTLGSYTHPSENTLGHIKINWEKYGKNNMQTTPELLETLIHEFGHHARIGNIPIEDLKADKLLKPYSWLKNPESRSLISKVRGEDIPYLTLPGELSMNMWDLSRDLGLKIGDAYPGKHVLKNILDHYRANNGTKTFVINDLKLSTNRDYKRVWDALTGKYFTIPVIGLGAKQVIDK